MNQDGRLIHKDDIPVLRDMKTAFLNGLPSSGRTVKKLFFGSGRSKCRGRWKLIIFGYPNGGEFSFKLTTPDPEDSQQTVERVMTFTVPFTVEEFIEELALHPVVADAENVEASTAGNGVVPNQEITFRFVKDGPKNVDVQITDEDYSALTGGLNPHSLLRWCCE